MQVGKDGISKYPQVLPWVLIKSETRVLQGSYPTVTLPYNTDQLARPAITGERSINLSIFKMRSVVYPLYLISWIKITLTIILVQTLGNVNKSCLKIHYLVLLLVSQQHCENLVIDFSTCFTLHRFMWVFLQSQNTCVLGFIFSLLKISSQIFMRHMFCSLSMECKIQWIYQTMFYNWLIGSISFPHFIKVEENIYNQISHRDGRNSTILM